MPGSGWIVGRANFGLHQFVAEQRPITRQDLDEAVSGRPVVVYSGLHVTTLNTAGLRAAGLLDGAVPPMGALIDPDTGRATEVWSWLPQPEFGVDAVAAAMAGLGASMFTARGVTTINDIVHTAEGVRVPGNSDSTGTQPEAANPFHGIWCALARCTRLGRELAPDERIGLDAALRMFTADAAWTCHLDDRGVPAPGKLADLVVLGTNPRQVPVDALPDVVVDQVWIGGEPRH